MNKISTLIAIILGAQIAFAQVEQVSIGASYSMQTFYNLRSGEVTSIPNDAWEVAFSNGSGADAGVFFNESPTNNTVEGTALELHLTEATSWEEVIDTSIFSDSTTRLYNPDVNWEEGAFNSMKDDSNFTDFGWGVYNPTNNVVQGSKIFALKMWDDAWVKLEIQSLQGGVYSFRTAGLDGSNERTYSVSKQEAFENDIIYFSLQNNSIVDIPDEYHLIFTRYLTPLDAGSERILEYYVTGVLSAPGVEVAAADGVDVGSVSEQDYSGLYTDSIRTIGHDWKNFDLGSFQWSIDRDRTYFVRLSEDEVYQLTFLDFEGSTTGITTIEKSLVGLPASSEVISAREADITICPNPFLDEFTIHTVSTEKLQLRLYNGMGQLVLSNTVLTGEKIFAGNLPSGTYFLLIQKGNQLISTKIIK